MPGVTLADIQDMLPERVQSVIASNKALALRLKTESHYSVLVQLQMEEVASVQKSDSLLLPVDLPYHQ